MHQFVAFALVAVSWLSVGPFGNSSSSGQCLPGPYGGAVDCGGSYTVQVPGRPGSAGATTPALHTSPTAAHPAPKSATPATPPTTSSVTFTVLGSSDCGSVVVINPGELVIGPVQGTCPKTAAPAEAPAKAVAPQTLAEQFWRTIPLPAPKPSVPPGYAVTGLRAYLVTGGTTDPAAYREETPLGELTVRATGRYLVDWGDPHDPGTDGPYTSEGEPWPDGTIVHTYDYMGTYTVTVTEDWSATWALGGETGTLSGLHTQATITGLRVEELEGVIRN